MTRINCIPVEELHDKHLLAEYRELPRVFKLARPCSDAPKKYVLGTGHVKFFYDKLTYLLNRQSDLIRECQKRGFKITNTHVGGLLSRNDDPHLWNDWVPTQEDMELNRSRINQRLSEMKGK